MKKNIEFKIAIIIVIGSIVFLSISDLLESLLNLSWDIEPDNTALVADIVVRILLIGILLFVARKLGLNKFFGFDRDLFIRNRAVVILPFLLILGGVLINWDLYTEANNFHLTLLLLSVLCVGLVEEFTFRGLVLPLFINRLKNRKRYLYKALILSSVFFGLVHYNHYLDTGDFLGVTTQVIYTIPVGVLLGAFMLRTGNVFVPALIHASFNFLFGHGLIENKEPDLNMENIELISTESSMEWIGHSVTIFMFLVILGIGLNMIKLVDEEAIKKDLESINI